MWHERLLALKPLAKASQPMSHPVVVGFCPVPAVIPAAVVAGVVVEPGAVVVFSVVVTNAEHALHVLGQSACISGSRGLVQKEGPRSGQLASLSTHVVSDPADDEPLVDVPLRAALHMATMPSSALEQAVVLGLKGIHWPAGQGWHTPLVLLVPDR